MSGRRCKVLARQFKTEHGRDVGRQWEWRRLKKAWLRRKRGRQ